jgi:uncharacterized protein (DUF362 family)
MTRRRIINSRYLSTELAHKELNRRSFIAAAASAAATLPGCASDTTPGSGEAFDTEALLVGLGADDDYALALDKALKQASGAAGLGFIESGDVVYLKINTNSGDANPYSTSPLMVELLSKMAFDLGASKVIVGDRSFWGDPNTYGNLVDNGIAGAADNVGAELMVFEDDDVEWVAISQEEAPDWVGGFRFPKAVIEADHIINLPCVKTHFISTFTMGMKNIIGLVNPTDRRRDGNLRTHSTQQNKLYKQTAQLNQHVTPSLTVLDGVKAVVRGGPNISGTPPGLVGEPGVIIASTDRIAADVTGLAVLKLHAVETEAVHDYGVWENPQIVEAVNAGVGIASAEEYSAAGVGYEDLDAVKALIAG